MPAWTVGTEAVRETGPGAKVDVRSQRRLLMSKSRRKFTAEFKARISMAGRGRYAPVFGVEPDCTRMNLGIGIICLNFRLFRKKREHHNCGLLQGAEGSITHEITHET